MTPRNYNVVLYSHAYLHPIEFAVGVFAFMSNLLILKSRMHLLTVAVWASYRTYETIGDHSGYEFSWSMFKLFPFGLDSHQHHLHHFKNDGNFGTFTCIWDWLFGTLRKEKED